MIDELEEIAKSYNTECYQIYTFPVSISKPQRIKELTEFCVKQALLFKAAILDVNELIINDFYGRINAKNTEKSQFFWNLREIKDEMNIKDFSLDVHLINQQVCSLREYVT